MTPVLHQACVEGCSEVWAELAVWSWRYLEWFERREDSMYVCALIETSCSTCEIVHGVDYSQGLLWAVACFFATTSVRGCRGSAVRWADHGGTAVCCAASVLSSPLLYLHPVLMLWLPSQWVVPHFEYNWKRFADFIPKCGSRGPEMVQWSDIPPCNLKGTNMVSIKCKHLFSEK